MADIEETYTTRTFNSLPDLHHAQDSFISKGGPDLVNNVLRPLIVQHKLESALGIGLLHRHFDLSGEEKLVEFNNISTPWKHQQGYNHTGGQILPCAWMIDGNSLVPYEFYFSPLRRDTRIDFGVMTLFLEEFIRCIKDSGLDMVFVFFLTSVLLGRWKSLKE
ncbi:uncharacterized protein PFLUO_LOCUS998, partial [Penicillium psychrofluorescens]|uniref:uncharacterized protein n=1 Tax=Penicillium psychrofluorescens TaxID=3158075 RepID=UPI003CCE2A12